MNRRLILQSVSCLVFGGLLVGGFWYNDEMRESQQCEYTLINPTRCERDRQFTNPEYEPTKNVIEKEIANRKTRGVTRVSVSFRDLRNGPSFQIHERESFLAMSLFKLPIMIRYLKDADGDPKILDEKITVSLSAETVNQNLSQDQTLVHGQQYTIRELLQKMIRNSDNHSRTALIEHYQTAKHDPDYDIVLDTLTELGIVDAKETGTPQEISLRSTVSIFRMLYNSSYLSRENSQLALQWLTESTFTEGLMKPLPSNILVANKFGLANEGTSKQLHDCGIIYYPQHPYVLCVMTKGENLEELKSTIATISKIVFDEVDRRYRR